MTSLHIYLPPVQEGEDMHVHLHIAGSERYPQSGDEDGLFLVTEQGPATEDADDRLETILNRWEQFTPGTPAREVFERLCDEGWDAYPPGQQAGSRSAASYIRFVYTGRSRRVVVYLNSVALVSNSSRDRDFLATLPGAEPSRRETYFRFEALDGVTNALAAVKALQRQANSAE